MTTTDEAFERAKRVRELAHYTFAAEASRYLARRVRAGLPLDELYREHVPMAHAQLEGEALALALDAEAHKCERYVQERKDWPA